MPAQEKTAPESLKERAKSAQQIRVQERAVTPKDYEDVVKRCRKKTCNVPPRRFAGRGSWRTVSIAVDRLGGATIDAKFANDLRVCIDPYRMAGLDLEVDLPGLVCARDVDDMS